jgi:hypothetical protein
VGDAVQGVGHSANAWNGGGLVGVLVRAVVGSQTAAGTPPESEGVMFEQADDNPYRAPLSLERGEWDHTLLWRLVKIGFAFAVAFGALDLVAWYQYRDRVNRNHSPVMAVVEFFRNWDRGIADPTQQQKGRP